MSYDEWSFKPSADFKLTLTTTVASTDGKVEVFNNGTGVKVTGTKFTPYQGDHGSDAAERIIRVNKTSASSYDLSTTWSNRDNPVNGFLHHISFNGKVSTDYYDGAIKRSAETGAYTYDQLNQMFDGGNAHVEGIRFNITRTSTPPTFTLDPAKNSAYSGDIMDFKLIHMTAGGVSYKGVVFDGLKDRLWYLFEGYQNGKRTNLYFTENDTTEVTWNFFYAESAEAAKKLIDESKGDSYDTDKTVSKVRRTVGYPEDIEILARMTHDYPKNNDGSEIEDCLDADSRERTGPKSKSENIRESLGDDQAIIDDLEGTASKLNSNCAATVKNNPTGWAAEWGLTTFDAEGIFQQIAGDCGINIITSAAGGIGESMKKLSECLVTQILQPMLRWAAELVQTAAGLSYWPTRSYSYTAMHETTIISRQFRLC